MIFVAVVYGAVILGCSSSHVILGGIFLVEAFFLPAAELAVLLTAYYDALCTGYTPVAA